MSLADRQKWDERYRTRGAEADPAPWLLTLDDVIPRRGRALDVAGGAGRHSIWLARRGLDVTNCDVSPEGLRLARERAAAAGVSIATVAADLEADTLPPGPWDVILNYHYLERRLYAQYAAALAPGGVLLYVHPTLTNLVKHAHPGPQHCLVHGELVGGFPGLTTVSYAERWWDDDDRHEVRLVGRR